MYLNKKNSLCNTLTSVVRALINICLSNLPNMK